MPRRSIDSENSGDYNDMAMSPKDGLDLMSWVRIKVDELNLKGRWIE